MKAFTIFALIFGVIMAATQIAPVVINAQNASKMKANAEMFKAQQHQKNIELCAAGKGTAIMYNGKHCK